MGTQGLVKMVHLAVVSSCQQMAPSGVHPANPLSTSSLQVSSPADIMSCRLCVRPQNVVHLQSFIANADCLGTLLSGLLRLMQASEAFVRGTNEGFRA